jgi:hypothetical protein
LSALVVLAGGIFVPGRFNFERLGARGRSGVESIGGRQYWTGSCESLFELMFVMLVLAADIYRRAVVLPRLAAATALG